MIAVLQFFDVVGLVTPVALDQIEFHLGVFLDRLEAVHDQLRIMEKDIAAIIKLNKTIALFLIKHLYFTLHLLLNLTLSSFSLQR